MSQCIRCQKEGAQWVRVHLDVDTYTEMCDPCREIWRARGIATTPVSTPSWPSAAAAELVGSGGTSDGQDAAAAGTA